MITPAGWIVTYVSGNRTAIIGEKKPDGHELFRSIEPFFTGKTPLLPADPSMTPHIEAAYVAGYEHRHGDKTFMPTMAARKRLALIGAAAHMKRLHIEQERAPAVNYTAAAEHLAFSMHGVSLAELSDKEQEDCRRWARSTINASLEKL
jgi:hypothetical protein